MKAVISVFLGAALGIAGGYLIWGSKCSKEQGFEAAVPASPEGEVAVGEEKPGAVVSDEDLANKLSSVMLPDDEYNRLMDAIHQTLMGLVLAQIEDSGLEVGKDVEDEIKAEIQAKFSREYFTKLNTQSMQEIPKTDLAAILRFYDSEAGKKFQKKSPEIIKKTMESVQADLATWLPSKVDTVVTKVKSGKDSAPKGNNNTKG
jgi:hypothetical protein